MTNSAAKLVGLAGLGMKSVFADRFEPYHGNDHNLTFEIVPAPGLKRKMLMHQLDDGTVKLTSIYTDPHSHGWDSEISNSQAGKNWDFSNPFKFKVQCGTFGACKSYKTYDHVRENDDAVAVHTLSQEKNDQENHAWKLKLQEYTPVMTLREIISGVFPVHDGAAEKDGVSFVAPQVSGGPKIIQLSVSTRDWEEVELRDGMTLHDIFTDHSVDFSVDILVSFVSNKYTDNQKISGFMGSSRKGLVFLARGSSQAKPESSFKIRLQRPPGTSVAVWNRVNASPIVAITRGGRFFSEETGEAFSRSDLRFAALESKLDSPAAKRSFLRPSEISSEANEHDDDDPEHDDVPELSPQSWRRFAREPVVCGIPNGKIC